MYAYDKFYRVPCTYMRGGTSKGLIIRTCDLPENAQLRDQVILRMFGSPDQNQIDGLGGATSQTSKLSLVGPPTHPDADIDYTFGQVSIDKSVIDYQPMCGNMTAAVGLFAAEEGFVKLTKPVTHVRIYNTNTCKIIAAEIQVNNDGIQHQGDFTIDGVPGASSKIMLNFLDAGGGLTGKTLPTGNPIDVVTLQDGREFQVTIVDSVNLLVFVRAEDVGISGTELGDVFNGNAELLRTLEQIRVEAGVKIGFITDRKQVTPTSHALPKIAVVAPSQSYVTSTNKQIDASDVDIVSRYITMGSLHKAYAGSGSIALATAVKVPGSLPNQLVTSTAPGIRLGHPSGTLYVEAEVEKNGSEWYVSRAANARTARRLMDGYAYVPVAVLSHSNQ